MANVSIFGRLTTVQMLLHTLLYGQRAGVDDAGNVYYRAKGKKNARRERRWVMYKNSPEASAVPPEWHGWLHHQTDAVPGAENVHRQKWQKPHEQNMTGTTARYAPPPLKGKKRAASTGDYIPWQPPQ